MNGCHKCEHAAAIADGAYADLEWEAVPCSTCDVMQGADRSFEVYDRIGDTGLPFDDDGESEGPATAPPGHLPITVMQDLVLGLLNLRPEVRDVVAWRYAGMRYEDIALVQGVTPQCVERRLCRAMEQWPVLEALFLEKVEKRKRRVRRAKNRRVV